MCVCFCGFLVCNMPIKCKQIHSTFREHHYPKSKWSSCYFLISEWNFCFLFFFCCRGLSFVFLLFVHIVSNIQEEYTASASCMLLLKLRYDKLFIRCVCVLLLSTYIAIPECLNVCLVHIFTDACKHASERASVCATKAIVKKGDTNTL